jgi:hypothetical protein
LVFDHFELGQLAQAEVAISKVTTLAERLDHPDYRWRVLAMQAMTYTFRGQFGEAERLQRRLEQLGQSVRDPNWHSALAWGRLVWHRAQGLRSPAAVIDRLATLYEGELYGKLAVWGELARLGERDQLRSAVDPEVLRAALLGGDPTALQDLAPIAIVLDDSRTLAQLYERLLPNEARFVSGGMTALTWEPTVGWTLGCIARALGQRQQAISHFSGALTAIVGAGARGYAALIECDLARVLCEGSPNRAEQQRAAELLRGARATAELLNMPELVKLVESLEQPSSRLPRSVSPASAAAPAASRMPDSASIEQDGELWCLAYQRQTLRLANTKGVRLLAQLVREPGREFHVLHLEGAGGGAKAPAGDAGPVVDDLARQDYQQRIGSLREQIAQAEAWNDNARASLLQFELDALSRELARAFGLGGRARPLGSAVERARINVQRRLKDAIRRVRAHAPEIAKHLERSVRTGTYCVYEP